MGATDHTAARLARGRRERPLAACAWCALAWSALAGVVLAGIAGPGSGAAHAGGAAPVSALVPGHAASLSPTPREAVDAAWSRQLASPVPSALPSADGSGAALAAASLQAAATRSGAAATSSPAPRAGASAAAQAPATKAAMAVSDPLSASSFNGLPQVGAVFAYNSGTFGDHYCSGSVVASPAGDVVVTAAHCVYDPSVGAYIADIAFVPGYHDGSMPYGIWVPTHVFVDSAWIDNADPDHDFAFMTVQAANGAKTKIQDVVGADTLGVNPSYTALSQVVGYPSTDDAPVACTNYTSEFSATQLEFDCAGYPGGTSGGPFLSGVNPVTGLGTVDGVVGGYESGGDTPDVSYASYFGPAAAALYAEAVAAG